MNFFQTSVGCDVERSVVRVPSGLRSREQVFDFFVRMLSFPNWFGRNWDAFDECMGDLSWLKWKRIAFVHEDIPCGIGTADAVAYLDCMLTAECRHRGRLYSVFPSELLDWIDRALIGSLCEEGASVHTVEEGLAFIREMDSDMQNVVPGFNNWTYRINPHRSGAGDVITLYRNSIQMLELNDVDSHDDILQNAEGLFAEMEYAEQKTMNEEFFRYAKDVTFGGGNGDGDVDFLNGGGEDNLKRFLFRYGVKVGNGVYGVNIRQALEYIRIVDSLGFQILSAIFYRDDGNGRFVERISQGWKITKMSNPTRKEAKRNIRSIRAYVEEVGRWLGTNIACFFVVDNRKPLVEFPVENGQDIVLDADMPRDGLTQ